MAVFSEEKWLGRTDLNRGASNREAAYLILSPPAVFFIPNGPLSPFFFTPISHCQLPSTREDTSRSTFIWRSALAVGPFATITFIIIVKGKLHVRASQILKPSR